MKDNGHKRIYAEEAALYDELVAREDREHVFSALSGLASWQGKDVAELGAGTGRLSLRIAPWARTLTLLDASAAMLALADRRLTEAGLTHVRCAVADHRRLPLASACADIVLAGWTLCYVASENVPQWRRQLRLAMDEVRRVLRPGGVAIIVETMGTGGESPEPPSFLQPYYRELEESYGFRSDWVRSDFRFASPEEAERLVRFFFGHDLADKVRDERLSVVPSCTGIWRREMPF